MMLLPKVKLGLQLFEHFIDACVQLTGSVASTGRIMGRNAQTPLTRNSRSDNRRLAQRFFAGLVKWLERLHQQNGHSELHYRWQNYCHAR